MKNAVFVIALAFQSSAALSQSLDETLAPDEDGIFSALGGSSSFGIGNLSQSGEFNANGPTIGFGFVGEFELDNGIPLYLEWNGSLASGSSNSSSTAVQGSQNYVFTSRISPVGSVDLSTKVDALGAASDATVNITDGTGDTATIVSSAFSPSAPGTAISQFATSLTDAGAIFTALTTNGETNTASAYGGILDESGFSFVGAGDGSSTSVTTTHDERVRVLQQSLFLGNSYTLDNDWRLATKVGPTYRSFDRDSLRRTTINIDEGYASPTAIPTASVDDTWSLSGKYYGAIVGAGLSRKITDDWSFNLGAEIGLARLKAKSTATELINFAGNAVSIPGLSNSISGTSHIGRLTGGLTHLTKSGAIISFGGYVDYMSDVPYLQFETVSSPNVSRSASSIGFVGSGETYRTHSIQKKKMVSTGLTLSFIYLF